MKDKILIVGGTGFFGYHLSKYFKKYYDVTSLSKNKPKKKRELSNISYMFGDISKKKTMSKLENKNFKYVINCSGYVNHIDKKSNYNNHFIGCKNLVELFKKKKNIKLFIQVGSSAEYGAHRSPQSEKKPGKPKTTYGISKLRASKYLSLRKNKDFPYVILRLYQLYGPKQDNNRFIPFVIKSCLEGKKFPCSECTQYRDFLYVDDAIRAVNKCLKNANKIKGKIINIGYGMPIKLKNIINVIKRKIGRGIPNYGKIKLRSDEIKKLYPSLNNAKNLLGWKPKVNFKHGINATIRYYEK